MTALWTLVSCWLAEAFEIVLLLLSLQEKQNANGTETMHEDKRGVTCSDSQLES